MADESPTDIILVIGPPGIIAVYRKDVPAYLARGYEEYVPSLGE